MPTPIVPYQLYVKSSDGKFSFPIPLSDLISPNPGNDLVLDGEGKLLVFSDGLLTAITELANDGANTLSLTFEKQDGSTVTIESDTLVQDVLLTLDATAKTLTTTVNGVASNALDVAGLFADINVEEFTWDSGTFVLRLKETDGTITNLDLSSLVAVNVANSISGDGTVASPLQLVNDLTAPGNLKVYGTDATGVKGWRTITSGFGADVSLTPANSTDIPLDYIGNPDVNLYAPFKFITAVNPTTGLPLQSAGGKDLLIPVYEAP